MKFPVGTVRHEFGENCPIDKYFRIHLKNCALVTLKTRIYKYQMYFCVCPHLLNNFEISFLNKKKFLKLGQFSGW